MHRFICRDCGAVHAKWMGKCPDCGTWDALESYRAPDPGAAMDPQRGTALDESQKAPSAISLAELAARNEPDVRPRFSTRIDELDRVLGATAAGDGRSVGGLVPGSAVLVGGDPGIGKSTLLLDAAARLAASGQRVLYVSSEESVHQIQLRARRLGADGVEQLYVLAETNLARIQQQARSTEPKVLIIDSIQMIYKGDLAAPPGSMTQLRSCCLELVYLAKASGCAVVFVGHVTKQGQLAGPRLLEHLVDTVLYFEGDRYHSHRIIRATKNRFGTTLEVGLFQMTDRGLDEVKGGTGLLAAEYRPGPGSVSCPVLQGSRCLMVEVEALTATGFLGAAKRRTSGLDGNRLAMLIAVLEKRGGQRLADQDIFASSAGGIRIAEPAADLAIALSIAGAHMNRGLPTRGDGLCTLCAVGEIGLGGQVRHVHQMDQRIGEAARLGFTEVICPPTEARPPQGCRIVPVRDVQEAIEILV